MKKIKSNLDVVFVIDKSGSMSGNEDNTISSFNEYLERESNNNYKTNVTTLFFNDTYEYLYRRSDIKKIKKMKKSEYVVGGCTALYDALGNSISYMDECNTDKVMFIIITDGYENASKKYDKDSKGTSILFKSVSNFQESMMSDCECCGTAWKEDLDNYIKDNI